MEIAISHNKNKYEGEIGTLSIKDRLLVKYNRQHKFEAHLQAFIIQNYDINSELNALLIDKPELPVLIGNEVSCGVGMQRIDIMTVQEDETIVYIGVNELKCVEPY